MKMEKIFNKKLTRGDFIKKGAIAIGTLALAGYTLNNYFLKKVSEASTTFKGEAPKELWKWSKEAQFYKKIGSNVQCLLCPHGCLLSKGDMGICRTRINFDGKLYTLSYGDPCLIHVDPIEKKPLFHFLPGTKAFSISTAGCNLRCLYCQNWEISQFKNSEVEFYDLFPEKLVEAALAQKQKDSTVLSIAYTYGEPVAYYDYMVDCSKIARDKLKNVVITAGYINEEPLKEMCKNVDAIKIDLKGFSNSFYKNVCGAQLEPVLNTIKAINKTDVWQEVVNLAVPTLNDDMGDMKQLCDWLAGINKDIPLHFSRFSPMYKLTNLPQTPLEALKKAREIALDAGLNYVYIGNVPHADYENTYCPRCKELVIERIGYEIKQNNLANGRCNKCGEKIPGVWNL